MSKRKSIILELQSLASEGDTDVLTLLRKALIVASKLNLSEFHDWICSEMNGYNGESKVPQYRQVKADLRARNPYLGMIPIQIQDADIMKMLCEVPLRPSIAQLQNVLEEPQEKGGYITSPLPHEYRQYLYNIQKNDLGDPLEPVRIIDWSQVASILDAVRDRVLKFALELEQQGIIGEGLTFSEEEQTQAKKITHINIGNMLGIVGDVTDSHVTQNLTMNVQQNDVASLRSALEVYGLETKDIDELGVALQEDPKPENSKTFGKRVSTWIGKMVTKAATGAWNIGVDKATTILSTAIRQYYGLS